MFEFGIWSPEQYARRAGDLHLLREGRVSYQLLRTSQPARPEEVERFERLMHQVRMPGGIYRATSIDRFLGLDQFLTDALGRRFERAAALDVQDWAASDCSTSSRWFPLLDAAFPAARLTASDLNLYLIEMRLAGRRTYIFDSAGVPLQYVRPPFVIRLNQAEPRRLLGNRYLQARARARLARFPFEAATIAFDEAGTFRKIPIVHPAAEALRLSRPAFRIERHSIFEPLAQGCDVVRTMNIFNRAYFDDVRILQGARAVWESLKPAGIWIVGRTIQDNPAVHHVSILERTAEGFAVVERYGEKSEVEELVAGAGR